MVLTSTHPTASAKRFLSRTARYSGLLNILDFAEVKDDNNDQLKEVLTGADAWLSFNVSEASIETMANLAFEAGVEKVLFTLELPPNRINETTIPAFDTAVEKYKKAATIQSIKVIGNTPWPKRPLGKEPAAATSPVTCFSRASE